MCSVYYEYAVNHAVRGFFPTVLKLFYNRTKAFNRKPTRTGYTTRRYFGVSQTHSSYVVDFLIKRLTGNQLFDYTNFVWYSLLSKINELGLILGQGIPTTLMS